MVVYKVISTWRCREVCGASFRPGVCTVSSLRLSESMPEIKYRVGTYLVMWVSASIKD